MTDIEKVAIFDDRIVQTRPKYGCEKGAVSLTSSASVAISQTASQHTYQIQVPSENIFVDRAVDWSSTVNLVVSFKATNATAPTNNTPILPIGKSMALASFPLHTLVQTVSATINDTTVTMNSGDVLREVLRLTDNSKNRSLRTCPTMLDTYASYNDAKDTNNNPLSGYNTAVSSDNVPNGAYPNLYFTDKDGNRLSGDGNYVDDTLPADHQHVYYVAGQPTYSTAGDAWQWANNAVIPLYVQFNSNEKLVLSPFIFSDIHEQEVGLFGLQNIQIVFNMASPSTLSTVGRVLRFATNSLGTAAAYTVSDVKYNNTTALPAFSNSKITCQFLTPSLDLPLPPKSIVNYMEFPRYVSVVPATALSNGTYTTQSSTITLPTIPDLIIIYAKPVAYKNYTDADYYLPITNISVNFDNFSGLLSSHTPYQLFSMSRANGLDMSYEQWIGKANNASKGVVNLTGGFLVLKPSKDITLSTGQAPSLIGNFSFQFNATIQPNNGYNEAVNLWVITANSGFFESQKGSSRIIKGVLNEKDIIDAPLSSLSTRSSINRAVGGVSFKNMLGNAISKVQEYLPVARQVAATVKPFLGMAGEQGKQAQQVMSALGLGHVKHRSNGSLSSRLM
jgi:hypothetical protein